MYWTNRYAKLLLMQDERENPEKKAFDLAVRRLGQREYGCAELAAYLERKGVDEKLAAATVARLVADGKLSDERYARVVAREQALRGKGPAYIANKLRRKGVQLHLGEVKTIYSEVSDISDTEAARKVVERRYPHYKSSREAARKAFQTLIRRGFSFDTARAVVSGSGVQLDADKSTDTDIEE